MEQCFLSSKDKSVRYNTRDLCELACQVKEKRSSITHIEQKETRYCNFRSLAGMEPAEVPPSGQKVARYIHITNELQIELLFQSFISDPSPIIGNACH